MNNIVIECRQVDDSTQTIDNGDFTCNFPPVEMYEGDVLSMRGVFVDTVSQNQRNINIKDNCLITISCGVYLYDWETKDRTYTNQVNQPSGQMYYMITDKSLERVIGAVFEPDDDTGGRGPSGGFECQFSYIDENGVSQVYKKSLPTFGPPNYTLAIGGTDPTLPNYGIIAQKDSFTLINPPLIHSQVERYKTNTDYKNYTTDPGYAPPARFGPAISTKTYNLPAGAYSPSELANSITRLLSENGSNVNSNFGNDSPFLKVSSEYNDTYVNNDGPYFIIANGNRIDPGLNRYSKYSELAHFYLSHTKNYWVGSNQISLEYDDTDSSSRFKFTYTHMPVYDTTGNISCGYLQDGNLELFPYDKNSGVYFTQFDTQYQTLDENIDLLTIMGFNRNKIICNLSPFVNQTEGGNPQIQQYLITPLTNEINVTSQYIGLDVLIDKKNGYNIAPANNAILAESQTTKEMVADEQFDELDNEPYFLIEIDAQFKTDLRFTKNIMRNIKGIVSKYYGYGSFTTAGEESDMQYVHIGEPTYLSSAHIRILNPDKQLAEDLGPNNTIFLELKRFGNPNIEESQNKKNKK